MNNAAIKMSDNDWRYLTFGLMGSGVVLRSCSQPWGAERVGCWAAHRAQNRSSWGRVRAAPSPNSKLQIPNASCPQLHCLGLDCKTLLLTQLGALCFPPRPEGWARTDFISFSTSPSFIISVLSNLSRGFCSNQRELGPLCQP